MSFKQSLSFRNSLSDKKKDYGKRIEVSQIAKIRCFIRKLNENKSWLGKIITELKDGKKERIEPYIDFEGDLLNIEEKLLLNTRSEARNETDVKRLAEKLYCMEPFHQYSQPIINHLVRHSHIVGFEAGRVVFDEGDESLGAYFILSGEVQQGPGESTGPAQRLLETIDRRNQEYFHDLKTDVYGKCSLIGMDGVLFGEARPKRMIVTKYALCIHFERKYIMKIFLPLINRWYEIFECLTNYEIFEHFDFEATRELSTIGKFWKCRADSLIDATDTSYFLVKGQVIVIQRLLVENYWNNGKLKKKLYHDQTALKYEKNVHAIFMQVCALNKGSYFGIGDRGSRNTFWATKPSVFLCFSKHILFRYGSPELWSTIRARLDAFYPSDSEIFRFYQYGRDWLNYKKDLSRQFNRGKGLATIHDVPVTLRCQHLRLKRSFMKKVKMTKMSDYLLGGIDPLMNENVEKFVLDEGGLLREYMFGWLKADPLPANDDNEDNINTRVHVNNDTFPSFFYYDVLK